ncbi:hydroxysteroid dehydrogenase-like protein 1 [Trichonephila clavipes]|nr:hydroxysteroid dehydrogenase-like protein 1 [Trichonephila clavipes]
MMLIEGPVWPSAKWVGSPPYPATAIIHPQTETRFIQDVIQWFKPTVFPGHLRYATANLDLILPVHKHNSLLAELRSAALATIHERYPDQDWLHVFTDGVTTASFGRAGTGALSNSFNLKEPLSAWSENFDGEIYAIFMAFRAISTTPGLNIVVFVDSQAAIKTYLTTIYSHPNLSSSANNLSTHFFAPEERSFFNGSHLIAAFMEKNKQTS